MPILQTTDASLYHDHAGARGPAVLMVQGVGAIGEGWRSMIQRLALDHQLAWLDNRGIGRSLPLRGPVTISAMAEDCLALLDSLGWERAHLCGHSMGGLIVQEVARRAKERVRSLSLLSTLRRGRDAALPPLSTLLDSMRMRMGPEKARWLAFAALGFPQEYRASVNEDALLAALRSAFCADFVRGPSIVSRQIMALFRHKGGDMTALGEIPTLLVTGALDRVVLTKYSDDLRVQLPHSRLVRFADAGHAIILQRPDEVAQLLREHIAKTEC
jgi:pimeloyl-ACP methyl ester carboxylesterase